MKRRLQFAFASAGLLIMSTALVSCMSVQPDAQRPELPMPESWNDAHGGSPTLLDEPSRRSNVPDSVPAGFTLFADPELNALQARALDNNADLRMALLRFAQSRVQRGMIAAGDQPTLLANAAASRQRQSETGSATRLLSALAPASQTQSLIDFISDPFALYQAGFDASWEPDLWGRVRHSLEAADAQVEESAAALAQVQLGLLSEVARGYFQLRGVQTQSRLLQQDIARADELLALLQTRTAAGLGTDAEVLGQKIVLSDLRSREPSLKEQEAQALNALSYLLGEMPGSLQALLAGQGDWTLGTVPDFTLGLPSSVAASRPDIQISEARLRQATARLGVADADLYPRIVLGAGLGLESLESGAFAEWGSHQWSIGPRLSLPLFDQGRRRATVTLRELQEQEAAIEFQRVVLNAWREVDSALNRYSAQRQRAAAVQAKLLQEQEARALVLSHYSNGLVDYRQVLLADQRVAAIQRELAESDTLLALDLVSLFKALGSAAPIQDSRTLP